MISDYFKFLFPDLTNVFYVAQIIIFFCPWVFILPELSHLIAPGHFKRSDPGYDWNSRCDIGTQANRDFASLNLWLFCFLNLLRKWEIVNLFTKFGKDASSQHLLIHTVILYLKEKK